MRTKGGRKGLPETPPPTSYFLSPIAKLGGQRVVQQDAALFPGRSPANGVGSRARNSAAPGAAARAAATLKVEGGDRPVRPRDETARSQDPDLKKVTLV